MIKIFDSLAAAYSSGIKGDISVDANGAYINTDDRPIDEIRAEKWKQIKAHRDNLYNNGGYKVGNDWFYSSDTAKLTQIGLLLMGSAIPTGTTIPLMDGRRSMATNTLAKQIFSAAAAQNEAISLASRTHKAALDSCEDPASYDFSDGWPETFGGDVES